MLMQHLLSPASFWTPEANVESAWTQHAPFAFWLMDAHRPGTLVELGTHHGYSYFAFNQALQKLALKCRCFAVDSWTGDDHAGYYGDQVFESVARYNGKHFSDFSELLRMTFSEALSHFEDGTIDLLHIDGRHFYDDVKHDFEAWLPKLSKRAVVLLHDTNVRARDFGVYRLWEELKPQYPHFEFLNGHGLGILGVGGDITLAVRSLFEATGEKEAAQAVREAYQRLGNAIVDRMNLEKLLPQSVPSARYGQSSTETHNLSAELEQLSAKHVHLTGLYDRLNETHTQLTALYDELQQRHTRLDAMYHESENARAQLAEYHADLEAEFGVLLNAQQELERSLTESRAAEAAFSTEYADFEEGDRRFKDEHVRLASLLQHSQTTLKLVQQQRWDALTEARRLRGELADVNAAKQNLQRSISESQIIIIRHRENERILSDELAKNRGQLDALMHSTSWRITKPVRAIGERIPTTGRPIVHKLSQLRFRDAVRLHRDWNLLSTSPLFHKEFYLDENLDVAGAGKDPALHYLLYGGFEGRNPHPLFDSAWYLKNNPDVAAAGINPLVHFLLQGAREQRSPCESFDSAFYFARNPDINADVNPLAHYLDTGAREGRDPSPHFDSDWYVNQYSISEMNPLVHYVRWGRFEGRPTKLTDAPNNLQNQARSSHQGRPRIVFISGEAHTPGHKYRVENLASALPSAFFDVTIIPETQLDKRVDEVTGAALVWIWRSRWSGPIGAAIARARQSLAHIIFDVDDLMFRPELAKTDLIDGIRTQNLTEEQVREFYSGVQAVLGHADHCTAPTTTLARELRDFSKPSTVIPNGFDSETLIRSRQAVLARKKTLAGNGAPLVRLGYAAGSYTHQRDFAVASNAIAEVLAEFPNTRLVLFKGSIQLEEFAELITREHQIEWRDRVPLSELQQEYARFDINLAPLEVGNRYCEAKSELKYFEAALVGVPTIASPTRPFADAVRPGKTGFLAANHDEWVASLRRLVQDPHLRASLATHALHEVLWLYGPERRTLLMTTFVNQLLAPPAVRSQLFALDTRHGNAVHFPEVEAAEYDVLYQSERRDASRVSVVIPLFNYEKYLPEALESVRAQTVRDIDVIVVDDQSTDDSAMVAERWLRRHAQDFNYVALLQNRRNAKLGRSRNTGVGFADTEFYLPLDPDNVLLPACIEKCLECLARTGAAFAYPTIEVFGDMTGTMGLAEFDPALLQCGNYIDAMAMVRKACWIAVGGYSALDPVGWEDYDFWCKLTERGLFGARVQEVVAKYRAHGTSMLRTVTELPDNKSLVIDDLNNRHPWLGLRVLKAQGLSENGHTNRINHLIGLDDLLPLLRCPETGEQLLKLNDSMLITPSGGKMWPIVKGRPVFTAEGDGITVHPETHLSNNIPEGAIRIIEQTPGLVLNLSAGGTAVSYPNVVELEYSIFKHTHVAGDVHRLPFQDNVFEAVVCLNAFEHYRDPHGAMNEINRILKPGGRLFMHTAFMQPLHEAPHHYYNCTEFGLREWLRSFQVEELTVSSNFNPVYSLSWLTSELEFAFAQGVSTDAAQTFRESPLSDFIQFWRDPETRKSPTWRQFYELPSEIQHKFAAGWQATAVKMTQLPASSAQDQDAQALRTV